MSARIQIDVMINGYAAELADLNIGAILKARCESQSAIKLKTGQYSHPHSPFSDGSVGDEGLAGHYKAQ